MFAESGSAIKNVITHYAIGETNKKASIPIKDKDAFVFLVFRRTPLCSGGNQSTKVLILVILKYLSRFFPKKRGFVKLY
jgi:hypothetical protein